MKRLRVKTALVTSFALLGLIVGSIGAFSLNRLAVSNENVRILATDWLPSVEGIKEMDTALSDLRSAYRDHILAINDATEQEAVATIAAQLDRFRKATEHYSKLAVEPHEKVELNQVLALLEKYRTLGDQMVALSAAQEDEKAKEVLYEMRQHSTAIAEKIDAIVKSNDVGVAELYQQSQDSFSRTFYISLAVIALSLALVGGLIWFALAGIAAPIQAITASMLRLASGDKASDIPFNGREDEIGEMASAVMVFRQNAIDNERLALEADRAQRTADETREAAGVAERKRNAAMAQATDGLAFGLKEMSEGNLTVQLSEPFAEDFEALRANFNSTVSQLQDALRSVAGATRSIDSGSNEISQSAEDLSKRTEQQAASLEETAAALDQITANVSNSSRRADEARNVALLANQSAAESGQVVANARQAMQRIEQSSNQIANIIGVIDEIAFQTNLLALNAGVEAARAGDQGKGFAVVAQEVRELAQRSASAAKEIKGLIQNSSVEVQSGVKLVIETGTSLKTIEDYIVTVNQHMDAIATSAREQSVGLAEVNTAVNLMDQVTQQNAAMVEETNAAGAALASESRNLQSLISQFRLGGDAAHQARSLRTAATALATKAPVSGSGSGSGARHQVSGNAAIKNWEDF